MVNSTLISDKVKREDVDVLYIPASEMAKESGVMATANVIMLTIYLKYKGLADTEILKKILPLSVKRKDAVAVNLKMMEKALTYFEEELT